MEHLPPWLRNVPLPPRPSTGGHATDDTPDWLREPAGSAPSAPPAPHQAASADDDMPDWLRDLQSEIGATPTGDTNLPDAPTHGDSDDTPDWLRDAGTDTPAPPPSREVPDPFGATGWLQSLSPSAGSDDEPEPPPTTTTSRIRMPVGATDWLRSIGQDLDAEDPKDPYRPQTELADDKSGVPDWLRDVSPSEIIETMAESEPEASEPSPQPVFDPLASNWLTEDPGADADERTVASGWDNKPPAQGEALAADSIPAWLRDVAPESFDSPAIQERPRDPGSLPDWLSAPEGEDVRTPLVGADVPDWLRDVADDDDA
ncbi:MAG: hypothetical protein HGB28_01405, partial [Oscillochloris sp.]|nr:hypothetical protein [Oscillochloris sp.]